MDDKYAFTWNYCDHAISQRDCLSKTSSSSSSSLTSQEVMRGNYTEADALPDRDLG
jgi:hypothetical protein